MVITGSRLDCRGLHANGGNFFLGRNGFFLFSMSLLRNGSRGGGGRFWGNGSEALHFGDELVQQARCLVVALTGLGDKFEVEVRHFGFWFGAGLNGRRRFRLGRLFWLCG